MMLYGVAFMAQVASTYALNQNLVGTRMRGTSTATLHTLVNVLSYGLGAPLAGFLSDQYAPWAGDHALRYALFSVAALYLLSALQFALIGRTLKADLDKAKDE